MHPLLMLGLITLLNKSDIAVITLVRLHPQMYSRYVSLKVRRTHLEAVRAMSAVTADLTTGAVKRGIP